MPSALKIVATPIGNIRDITLRALDELKNADLILAEDTRHTKALIAKLGLKLKSSARLISCDAHKEESRAELVLSMLEHNCQVTLVSDAGSPAISDPGSLLVQAVIAGGARIEVLPGASAMTAAIMGAGIDTTRFAFLGFLPKKSSARLKIISSAARAELALLFYESPLRVQALLDELYEILGPRRVVVARELTKIFETFHRGILGSALSPELTPKGECVIIVESEVVSEKPREDQHEEVLNLIKHSAKSTKSLVAILVENYNFKKKDAYNLVLKSRAI